MNNFIGKDYKLPADYGKRNKLISAFKRLVNFLNTPLGDYEEMDLALKNKIEIDALQASIQETRSILDRRKHSYDIELERRGESKLGRRKDDKNVKCIVTKHILRELYSVGDMDGFRKLWTQNGILFSVFFFQAEDGIRDKAT